MDYQKELLKIAKELMSSEYESDDDEKGDPKPLWNRDLKRMQTKTLKDYLDGTTKSHSFHRNKAQTTSGIRKINHTSNANYFAQRSKEIMNELQNRQNK